MSCLLHQKTVKDHKNMLSCNETHSTGSVACDALGGLKAKKTKMKFDTNSKHTRWRSHTKEAEATQRIAWSGLERRK